MEFTVFEGMVIIASSLVSFIIGIIIGIYFLLRR
jgi:uncharacterized protein YneF (UPF0154 family)